MGMKDLDPKETFIPFHVDLRNGVITRSGNWGKRNGYTEYRDTTADESVNGLVSIDEGYAVTDLGKIFTLNVTPARVTPYDLNGIHRPTWVKFTDYFIIADGGTVTKVQGTTSTRLFEGIRPRYLGRVGAYTLYAGYDDTEFTWSATNAPENVTTGDSGFANVKKTGDIKFARDFRNKWFIFKDNEIEIWHNRGGSTPFVRLNELTIPVGLGASYSVVEANQTLYWIDPHKKGRVLNGANAQIITSQYEGYLFDRIENLDEVYGFNYEKENAIRWFSPIDGICIKYDYEKQLFSEDNHFEHGQYERLPHNSYMEFNGVQLFGDFDPTGKVFNWSSDYKDDNGTEIRVLRDFKVKLSESGNQALVNRMRFMLKRGVDTTSETTPEMLFRWRFDEDSEDIEWRTETISLGIGADVQPYVDIFSLGIGRTIHMQIIENDAVDFLLLGMLITTKEMGI